MSKLQAVSRKGTQQMMGIFLIIAGLIFTISVKAASPVPYAGPDTRHFAVGEPYDVLQIGGTPASAPNVVAPARVQPATSHLGPDTRKFAVGQSYTVRPLQVAERHVAAKPAGKSTLQVCRDELAVIQGQAAQSATALSASEAQVAQMTTKLAAAEGDLKASEGRVQKKDRELTVARDKLVTVNTALSNSMEYWLVVVIAAIALLIGWGIGRGRRRTP